VEDGNEKIVYRRSLTITSGKPIEMADSVETADRKPASPLCIATAETLKAYAKAGRELVNGEFSSVQDLAPPNFRAPCHIYVVCCPDKVLARYDAAGQEEPKVRSTGQPDSLTKLAPLFSEYLVHSPDDPTAYVPEHLGPGIIFNAGQEVRATEFARVPADAKPPQSRCAER